MADITGTGNIALPINVDLQRTALIVAKQNCPYFAGSKPASISMNGGTATAKWVRYEHLTPTTTALTELSGNATYPTRVGRQATQTNITTTVAKYGDHVVLTEEMDVYQPSNMEFEITDRIGAQAGRSLNRLQRDEVEENSTQVISNQTGNGSAADTDVLTKIQLNDIKYCVNQLERNSAMKFTSMTTGSQNTGTAPILPSFWGFNHPDVAEDVRALVGFTSVEKYAGQTETAQGEYGQIGRVRMIVSEEASIDAEAGGNSTTNGVRTSGNTTADVYTTVILGMDAHGSVGLGTEHIAEIYKAGDQLPGVQIIAKPRGSAGTADPLNELMTIGWKSFHASAILNSSWTIAIRSGADVL